MNNEFNEKPFNKPIKNLQKVVAVLQITYSSVIIFFGCLLLLLMAIYGFSNSDVTYYTPLLLAISVCAVGFSIALIILTSQFFRSANAGKSIAITIAVIILNCVFILLWIGAVASEYRGYASLWPFIVYCLPLIPLIAIVILTSVVLFLTKRKNAD